MTEETILKPVTMGRILQEVSDELAKRGFHAAISLKQETYRNGSQGFKIQSTDFQTTPVIFKNIQLTAFNANLKQDGANYRVWIAVHVSYEHFGGGSNGCKLFDFTCTINPASHSDGVFDIAVR